MSLLAKARFKAGLTILELLVVLSALSILLALILPLLSRGRELSYRAVCAGNLKQLSCAFALYSNDWNGFWPCPGGLIGDRTYWSQSGPGGLESYVNQRGNKSVWCCPSMPDWTCAYPPRTYTMNSYLREAKNGRCDIEYPTCINFLSGIRTGRLLQPQRTILLFEGLPLVWGWENGRTDLYIYRCCNWTGVRGYYDKVARTVDPGKAWHGRVNDYLYCDGHIVARPPGATVKNGYNMPNCNLSTYQEMYEWYADKTIFQANYNYWRQARMIAEH